MSLVTLTLRTTPSVALEAPSIRPDAFLTLSEAEIARLKVLLGKDEMALGELFTVEGGGSDEVRVRGDAARVKHLGAGMASGRLVVEGRAGMHAGAGMRGGEIRIEGDADDWTGAEMHGGLIEVRGNAGAQLGGAYAGSRHGMKGGTVLVHGSVGSHAGDRMRRGVVAVGGSAGEYAGCRLIAGTLLACGNLARGAGLGMKRGTIVALGAVEILPTFRYACTYRPGFLALLFRSLAVRGFPLAGPLAQGAFRRYGGDFTEKGRGEILQWTGTA